jgi:hypothetical protein
VPCIEMSTRCARARWAVATLVVVALAAGCASRRDPSSTTQAPAPAPSAPLPTAGATSPSLPGPTARARNWQDYQRRAAQRLMEANPGRTYTVKAPEPLLAIPVLEVELEADGRVRRVNVLRVPTQAKDTTQMAIDAVYRAAPFGDVTHLPRPWRFSEAFLFDDARRFKPRILD